jgi:YidC/Oxa1 family membrane protein insertase
VIAFGPWQSLLDGLGWILAAIYDVIGNFGFSIIVLTVLIRLVLLPLGIKQIKSMQHMQAIQPQIKALQKKYKGNKPKIQEETMKLYRDAGVNPLGGCLPLLLQFPILIAMYSVLRSPAPNAEYVSPIETPDVPAFVNIHYPVDSELYFDVTTHEEGGLTFLFMNLQCSLVQAGDQVEVPDSAGEPSGQTLDCGSSKVLNTIPYALLLLLMVGTTFYQQRQMQKASPPGAQSPQQQAILKYMPLMFAFFGLTFPAGLVLYWTTSNAFQIGQQAFLLRAGHIGPEALERRMAEQRAKTESGEPAKKGFMARLMEKAEQAQEPEQPSKPQSGGARPAKGSSGSAKGSSGSAKGSPKGKGGPKRPNGDTGG